MDKKWLCMKCETIIQSVDTPKACSGNECDGIEFALVVKHIKTEKVEEKQEAVTSRIPEIDYKKIIAGVAEAIQKDNVDIDEKYAALKKDVSKALDIQQKKVPPAPERKGEFDIDTKDLPKIATKFMGMDFDMLLTLDTTDPMLKSVQEMNDDLYVMQTLLALGGKSIKDTKYYHNAVNSPEFKAMYYNAGDGQEWVPTGFSAQVIELVDLALRVAALHPRFKMTKKIQELPGVTGHLKAWRATGVAAGSDAPSKFTASQRGTRKVVFTAELLTGRAVYEMDLEEDSIVSLLPQLKADMAYAIAAAIEWTIINGDTAGLRDKTDLHAGNCTATASPTKLWDGYREIASDSNNQTDQGGTFATSGEAIRLAFAKMGKYGLNPNEGVIVSGVRGYLEAILAVTNVQTVDKYGAKAVIHTGEVARSYGRPIIVSEYQREDLSVSGVSGGATSVNVSTAMQMVWKRGFMLADRRNITMEAAKIQGTDSFEVWGTWRGDFQPLYQTSENVIEDIFDLY